MPLVRVEVRNEYGLGLHELYGDANREDPKAVLDGVAVAGLVGILRQLGDLAEFAAEVFHGLQEQVTTTASRSHKLLVRVHHIEAALPMLEKSILAQRSHIHFAYTAGSNWHASIPNERNHFIYHDLPRFIMDSYEECCDPPRLHFLDKFDSGGPGSCLKRYSDPTFFKRASVGSDEPSAEKAQKDKARKIKKKRSLQRNGEVSRVASISNRSQRVQSASTNVHGQASPTHTVSTVDMRLKSDLGDHSNSFDSRTGSSYIECVFQLSSSIQSEEQQCQGPSSMLKMQNRDTFDSASPDGQIRLSDNEFPQNSPQEQTAPISSCVTWDEKTEIVEPKVRECDSDEAPELHPTNCDLGTQERAPVSIRSVDQMGILLDNENSPKSILGGNQIDDIESETDNYVDALNTIDSEFESDFDCQTKREVEPFSNFNTEGIEDEGHRIHDPYHHPPDFESPTVSHSSSNQGMSSNLVDSVPSISLTNDQSSPLADKSPHPDSAPVIELCGIADVLDGSKPESVIGNPSSSTSTIPNAQAPVDDQIENSFCKSRESSTDISSVHSVKFWTNGGLLGLEPSKPPDFSMSNAVNPDSGSSACSVIQTGDPHSRKLDGSVENSVSIEKDLVPKCSASCPGEQEDSIAVKKKSWGFSPPGLDAKPEKLSDSCHSASFSQVHDHGLNVTSSETPRTELPIAANVKTTFIEASQENDENPSRGFGLGHRILMNGFRRNVPFVHDEKSEPASSTKSSVFEQTSGHHSGSYQTYPEVSTKKQFGRESPVNSLTSSPPLEQMKISFHPISGFETSKLKLKFPDGSHCNESIRDMFPSFQLVPEPATPLHDIDFDSDDDMFCRSSPSMSDDCLSHHSESNSEQWESGEIPMSKDQELYDALCRMSTTESVSSSQELEGSAHGTIHLETGKFENNVEPSQSGLLLDLPSFDVVNPSLKQDIKHDSDSKVLIELQYPKESMPPPPPLPPLQWRVMKPYFDMAEDKQDVVSEDLENLFDLKVLGSTDSQQPEPVPAKPQQDVEAITCEPTSKVIEKQDYRQKKNGQKEVNQAANGKGIDEREDFLQQIRTKSFSLRRIATPRPIFTPVPATNVKVTAILEKANAIRQAVGSDDGDDDDNWSDA